MRLYEVAKDLGIDNKELLTRVRALGIDVKNHMSNLDVEDINRVRRAMEKERQANVVETKVSTTIIRRRAKDAPAAATPVAAAAPTTIFPPEEAPPPREAPRTIYDAKSKPATKESVEAQEAITTKIPAQAVEEAVRATPPAEPAPRVEAPAPVAPPPAAAAEPVAVAAAAPEVPATPAKPEPVKYGPTGRMIQLPTPTPRVEVTQANRYQERDMRSPAGPRWEVVPGQQNRFPTSRQSPYGKKRMPMGGPKKMGGKSTQITTPAAHKRVIKMDETVAVGELAKLMGIKATDVLKKLWSMGMTGITLNNAIDHDTAVLLATDFGFEVENTAFQEADVFQTEADKAEDLLPRAPVVTIMGHVDHGKTSLLDAIRDADVASGEAGGITQHIGAYKVTGPDGNDVVFLDTPGHEAFTAMRARGAQVTDLVILVVAADDGVMPTTVEALNHAKEAKVEIIVAVNKIDKQGAQPERIRQQLSDHGLIPEAWGGNTMYVDVSARNKTGIDTLLQSIALQSEVLELKANPNKQAKGTVVEARLDRNRGPMATILVQEGTLKVGDTVTAGEHVGKVRAMLDDKGRTLTSAGPSTPVEVLGIGGVPEAGETINAVVDEKAARELVDHRRDQRRKKELAGSSRVTLENILDRIKEGAVKELKVILKADVQGSAEALKAALTALSGDQVKVEVISAGVGGITETDVNLAKAGNAIIVGFHVRPAGKAASLAEQEGVDIKLYDIIYEALDDVKKAMAGLLAPVRREKAMGKAEVREVFNIPKIGAIAGSFVTEGNIKRNAQARLVRDSVQIWTGKLTSLRRFKDDAREVAQGYECGIGLENYNDIKQGDVIEAFEIEEIAPTLN